MCSQWTKSLVKRSKETEEPTLKTTKGSLILERQDYFESIIKELIKNNENYSNYDMNDIKNAAIRILITKLKFPMVNICLLILTIFYLEERMRE